MHRMQRPVRLAFACLLGCVLSACPAAEVSSIAHHGDGPSATVPTSEQQRLGASIGWLLVCGWLLGPFRGFARRCSSALLVHERTPVAAMGLWGGASIAGSGPGRRVRVAPRLALLPITASAAGVLLVWFEPADFLALRSISIYFGIAALSVALTLMNGGGPNRRRLRSALEMLGRMLVLGVLVACACALSGTRSLDGIAAEQGGWPWTWAGLRIPALLVALPLYIAHASELGATTLPLPAGATTPGAQVTRFTRLLDVSVIAERVLTNVALCALGVVLFAGGWQSPAELQWDGLPARLPGAALFVIKVWCFACLLAWARNARWGARLRPHAAVLGCALTSGLTGLWLWLDPALALQLEIVFGRALGAAALPIAAAAVVRRWAGDRGQGTGVAVRSAAATLPAAPTSARRETAPGVAIEQERCL